MSVSEEMMKLKPVSGLLCLGLAISASLLNSSVAFASGDEEKLKELERAMRSAAPVAAEIGTEGKAKKVRTRAIVFDAEPQSGSSVQEAAIQKAAASGGKDCQALPPGVDAVAVDFAINFNAGSATIAPSSEATLSQIGKVLSLNPSSCIIVEGHTDASGNADKNIELSRNRAESVVDFVTNKSGIERKRLVPVGKGSSDTLKNLSARDPKNRRVVFKVVTG